MEGCEATKKDVRQHVTEDLSAVCWPQAAGIDVIGWYERHICHKEMKDA